MFNFLHASVRKMLLMISPGCGTAAHDSPANSPFCGVSLHFHLPAPEGENGSFLPALHSTWQYLSLTAIWLETSCSKYHSHIFKSEGKCRKGQNGAGLTSRHTDCHEMKGETGKGIWILSLIITFRREGKYLNANLPNGTNIRNVVLEYWKQRGWGYSPVENCVWREHPGLQLTPLLHFHVSQFI